MNTSPNFQLVPQQNNNSNSKVRKPYTISKQRENWTEDEHQKFLEALTLYDRDWKKIESFVGTKTVIQIRSHAQKYFLKIQRNNTGERIPPPRPKRKSIQPYPQKQKIGESLGGLGVIIPDSLSNNPYISSAAFANWMSIKGLMPSSNPNMDGQMNSNDQLPRFQFEHLQQAQKYIEQAMASQTANRGNQNNPNLNNNNNNNIMNNNNNMNNQASFPKIYSFLSNLFDSNSNPSLSQEALNEMTPADRETMQVLMHNLAVNLANQQYRDNHQALLEQFRAMGKREEEDDLSSSTDDGMGGSLRNSTNEAYYDQNQNQLNISNLSNLNGLNQQNQQYQQQMQGQNLNMLTQGHQMNLNLPNTLNNINTINMNNNINNMNNLNNLNNLNSLNSLSNFNNLGNINLNNPNIMSQHKSFIPNPQTTF
ncbi:myb domain-containing protein [Tieghemostelium lacteum]|uniref:Myb domain-containing protein n=1 Tax=Tieghemostelium lacteum TaxID=361077 RepID=A0A151ZSP7_TIELA|nr:myb domain-containing protein [Tieghemostelium lacteum]|eukprot:KYQ96936.1 myb domain-containing protein [Tieghemostelium lacteum]